MSATILYVINALGSGGAERQLVALATSLDPERFAPEVAVLEAGGRYAAELDRAGVPVRVFPRRGRFDVTFMPALVRHARRFDLVHTYLTPATLFGHLAARLAGVPVRVGSERGSSYTHATPLHGPLLRAERYLLASSSGVIANSASGAAYARANGVPEARTHVVYNALAPGWPPGDPAPDAVRKRLFVPEGAFVLFTAASFRSKKDHATLLDALRLLALERIPALGLLAGSGPLEGEIRARAGALGLAGNVRFLGERPDVAELLAAADVAVLSSKEREGCSNFLMEAQSLGVPVVATDVGGTPEVVSRGESGVLVPAGDARALAAALAELARNPDRGRLLGERGRVIARERFGLERMVDETMALYELWLESEGRSACASSF